MKSYCDAKYCSPSTWSSISICPWQGRGKVLLVTGKSYTLRIAQGNHLQSFGTQEWSLLIMQLSCFMSCKLYLWGVPALLWTTLCQVAAGSQPQTMTLYLSHIKHLSSLNSHLIHTSCPQTPGVSHRQCWAPVPNQCFSAGNTGTQTHPWLRTQPDSEPTYHFVFKGSFKLQPSVAGAPVVNDNNNIA